ncbi:type III-A CRISPR-associated RAMP protein Csm4 [Nitrosomonas mobilis]|uniref:CRISPR system Cms protein Csm4 n=1 Tax=Nitrosomonas mobilis TaxID=51642 RepID=A0A1G5SGX0_9PROT|nr:hypothetical protein [Nitrosomonas mobilis]SCZ85639.1 conserved hypothetical protein [Nitrosomonas mobilis]
MTPLRVTLRLRSPLGTPLTGDTLFGQLCHAVHEMLGEEKLETLLDGYTAGSPWLVVSDGFPSGYLPRPTVPATLQANSGEDPARRKEAKGKRWIPHDQIAQPLRQLLSSAVSDEEVYGKQDRPIQAVAFHNTLNRLTGTTGTGEFAPYTQSQIFYQRDQHMDLWCVLDEDRLPHETLLQLLEYIGNVGYGRDASIGLGKFAVEQMVEAALFKQAHPHANACWTLAPCTPQGLGFNTSRSYWQVLTRFGRHGGTLALGANPFKQPLLLAATGAIFTPTGNRAHTRFIGNGLAKVSLIQKTAVHQGYAPVLRICMEAI